MQEYIYKYWHTILIAVIILAIIAGFTYDTFNAWFWAA